MHLDRVEAQEEEGKATKGGMEEKEEKKEGMEGGNEEKKRKNKKELKGWTWEGKRKAREELSCSLPVPLIRKCIAFAPRSKK